MARSDKDDTDYSFARFMVQKLEITYWTASGADTAEAIYLPKKKRTLSPVVRLFNETRKRCCIGGFLGTISTYSIIDPGGACCID
jgi:hypothetical protein